MGDVRHAPEFECPHTMQDFTERISDLTVARQNAAAYIKAMDESYGIFLWPREATEYLNQRYGSGQKNPNLQHPEYITQTMANYHAEMQDKMDAVHGVGRYAVDAQTRRAV